MKEWVLPTLWSLLLWGIWGFIPKLTTQYLTPKSAIVYEVIGGIVLGVGVLASLNFRPVIHPTGIFLAITTGVVGFLGALCFLDALSKGPVTLVSTVSSLYPIISIVLANLFLQEVVTLRQGLGIVMALLAMILVAT